MYSSRDLQGLVNDYERDIIRANNLERNPECNKEKEEEGKICKISMITFPNFNAAYLDNLHCQTDSAIIPKLK
jgi:hypothetical protein